MSGRKISAAVLMLLFGASVAIACGPYFPWQLLDDRTFTLKSTPTNSFAFEAAHLVPPPRDHLKAVELGYTENYTADERDVVTKAEVAGLPQDQLELLENTWRAADGDAAFAAGNGLPPSIRLYSAGALSFRQSDFAPAEKRFEAVLALPADQERVRSTWAAYMLGRAYAQDKDIARATAAFDQVRVLAIRGVPDPLGLATASFGEEARFHYAAANASLVASPAAKPTSGDSDASAPPDLSFIGYTLPSQDAEPYRHELTAAVTLYAEQSARGSNLGVQSLRIVAEGILSDPSRIDAAVTSPILQRLLVVYVLARVRDNSQQDDLGHAPDAGSHEQGITLNPILPALIAAIEKQGIGHPSGADRLAALCYRTGRYDLAARMANQSSGPLAEWVKAKIATQRGDLAAAAQHYAVASRAFPAADRNSPLEPDNMNLIQGDRGVVALARGEYVEALNTLYPVAQTYWGDVAYISERVLTLDELKDFVDAKVHVSPQAAKTGGDNPTVTDPAISLRNLLARRLMREARYDEALQYFNDPKIGQQAKDYANALSEADRDWGRVDSANALFRAAVIAREAGIDILGYEASPDFEWTGGDFDTGVGQDTLNGPYITADEHKRFLASQAVPNQRFHYRYIAADEASRAADLLPARSQAFAAVLCSATGWLLDRDSAGAHALYRRYVTQGAHVKWAAHFGRNCPQPDIDGAIALERVQPFRDARRFASLHRWWLAGIVLFAGVSGTTMALRRKQTAAGIRALGRSASNFAAKIGQLFRRRAE